jgi:hypothetical protein
MRLSSGSLIAGLVLVPDAPQPKTRVSYCSLVSWLYPDPTTYFAASSVSFVIS